MGEVCSWASYLGDWFSLMEPDFRVAIDTGSSDLWVVPPADFEFDTQGSIPVEIGYGGGVVSGTIGFAQMQLEGYGVSSQGAFLQQ
jgi:hypothetical protein